MTVLPGSLDYLYYNGVLDHIPYEAYEMPQYMSSASSSRGDRDYIQSRDSYIKSDKSSSIMSSEYTNPYRTDKNDIFVSESNGESSIYNSSIGEKPLNKEKVLTTPAILKGLAGVVVMVGTIFLLVKGRKKP